MLNEKGHLTHLIFINPHETWNESRDYKCPQTAPSFNSIGTSGPALGPDKVKKIAILRGHNSIMTDANGLKFGVCLVRSHACLRPKFRGDL